VKIALISPAYPLRGGIAASSERLAQALQEAGHTVTIYSYRLQYPGFLFPGKTQYSDDPPPADLEIVTCIHSVWPLNWLWTGRRIGRTQPDRVVVRYWMPFMGPCLGTVLRVARFFCKTPLRITALTDNIIPHEKRPGDTLFSRYFARACDDFVVMSRSVGTEIEQILGKEQLEHRRQRGIAEPVRFAPHPVYDIYGPPLPRAEARRALGLPEQVPIMLFFGLIRAYKGLDIFLEALARLPDVHALIAGECYEEWATYQRLIDAHGMAERVHLHLNFIPSESVRHYFCAADLLVQPYKTATQSGISQIAYHFGLPMAVSDVGGLPEIVTHGVTGYVTAPEPIAVAAAVRDFLEHNRAGAMRQAVEKERRRFSWENLLNKLLIVNC
jgi:glycosyltransferase involved in cell wall biosynthesis